MLGSSSLIKSRLQEFIYVMAHYGALRTSHIIWDARDVLWTQS